MLSKELKIGNYVNCDFEENPLKIHAKHIVEQYQADIVNVKYLEPILINSDILDKMNFRILKENSILIWFTNGIFKIKYSKTSKEYYLAIYKKCKIKYVHQLQNIISDFTGKNIEFIL